MTFIHQINLHLKIATCEVKSKLFEMQHYDNMLTCF